MEPDEWREILGQSLFITPCYPSLPLWREKQLMRSAFREAEEDSVSDIS
jgi:hypothetical protein